MKKTILSLLFLLTIPMTGFGQSTLNFPKLFTPAELPNTGFAIVNPGAASAAVTFTLYSATGQTVSTKTFSGAEAIAAGGQFARSGDQIFASLGSGGWVQVDSAASGLTGFWINYAGDLSYLDGADGATTVTTGVFPLIAGQTQINVVNLAVATNNVEFHIHAADGTEIAPASSKQISSKGVYSAQVNELFPGVNVNNANYVRAIALGGSITGTSLIRGYLVSVESAVVNMTDGLTTSNEANFPHVVNGLISGLNYNTVVDVVNLAPAPQTVTITFTPDAGAAVSVQRTLPVLGALRDTANNLFGLSSTFVGGFVKVTGTASLTGFAAFADNVGGQLAVVPVGTAKSSMIFAHIADDTPWQTGLAFLNPGSTTATVEIFALRPDGTLYGSTTITIPGGKKMPAAVIHELIPAVAAHNSGFVFVRSNVPLHGAELFYTGDGRVLSNVAAGVAGSYSPPAPAAPVSLTSISPTTVARSGTLTVVGTGFSTTAANNAVRFAAATGTVEAAASTATTTTLSVTVPANAISGPVSVRVGGQTSASLVLTVTQTATSQVQSLIDVTAGATVSNLDIYVPTNAAPANITLIGIAAAGGSSFETSTSSLELTRGDTRDLLVLLGSASLTQANGTVLTISGSNVSVTNPRFVTLTGGTPGLIVQVQATGAAATGSRNIVVTNNSLDTTVFTGGLIIK